MRRLRLFVLALTLTTALLHSLPFPVHQPTHAADRPFALPFYPASSPATWLLEQHYGNTVEAYTYGKFWYADGQGLHFGLDLEAPCGTTITAVADGVVRWVDNGTFGAEPHNLVIDHEALGYASVYGHLNRKPRLMPGQPVRRGQAIGEVGDPDGTCFSRPHLHLEIRSLDYRTAYNPALLINADWDMLALLGEPIGITFARDLEKPRRWQSLADQPSVQFGNFPLNNFRAVWPPPMRLEPTAVTRPALSLPATADTFSANRLTNAGCCTGAWWSSDSRSVYYLDAGRAGELASLFALDADLLGGAPTLGQVSFVSGAPPPIFSADGRFAVRVTNRATLTRLATAEAPAQSWQLATRGAWPVISPGSQWIMWHVRPGDYFPDFALPRTELWIAAMPGTAGTENAPGEPRLIRQGQGGTVYWLDDDRLLIVETEPRSQRYRLSIYRISDDTLTPLAELDYMRRLSVAPGGRHLLMLMPFQQPAEASGIYLLETRPGARPQKLPFVGGYAWRDSDSLYYIPYRANVQAVGEPMSLHLYTLATGSDQVLASGFRVSNGEWSVSPDGRRIVYLSAEDGALWVLDATGTPVAITESTPTATPNASRTF